MVCARQILKNLPENKKAMRHGQYGGWLSRLCLARAPVVTPACRHCLKLLWCGLSEGGVWACGLHSHSSGLLVAGGLNERGNCLPASHQIRPTKLRLLVRPGLGWAGLGPSWFPHTRTRAALPAGQSVPGLREYAAVLVRRLSRVSIYNARGLRRSSCMK